MKAATVLAVLALLAAPSHALTPPQALTRLAQAEQLDPKWFTSAFAPLLGTVQESFRGFRAQYGPLRGVETAGPSTYRLRYEHGQVTVAVTLDSSGTITGLRLLEVQGTVRPEEAERVKTALLELLNSERVRAEQFAPSFLQAVPIAQLRQVLREATGGLGRALRVNALKDGGYQVEFERGVLPVPTAVLDPGGRFVGLRVLPAEKPKPAP